MDSDSNDDRARVIVAAGATLTLADIRFTVHSSNTQVQRMEMSEIAANAQVQIAERRFAVPARWGAGSAFACVFVTMAAVVAVAFAPIEALYKAAICVAIASAGGGSSILIFRKLIDKLTAT